MTTTIHRDALAIDVRHEGEYGTFFVREAVRHDRGTTYHSCQLTINSSFGTVGYLWSHMGRPAREFFDSVDKSYFLQKLWGDHYQVFDSKQAVNDAKRVLLVRRHLHYYEANETRHAFNELEELGSHCDEHEYIAAVMGNQLLWQLAMEGSFTSTIVNPQAEGIWRDLWPHFVQGLKDEFASRPFP